VGDPREDDDLLAQAPCHPRAGLRVLVDH
jgi:hypothetical protein